MKSNEELLSEKESLKDKYKKVFELKVATNEEENEFCTIFLRPLDEVAYKATMKIIEQDELAAAKVLINSLYIGGDTKETITGDFDNLLAASKQLGHMYRTKAASIDVLVKKK
jgi:hypothetical protein